MTYTPLPLQTDLFSAVSLGLMCKVEINHSPASQLVYPTGNIYVPFACAHDMG